MKRLIADHGATASDRSGTTSAATETAGEAMFRRLKDFRRIATRYDKLAGNCLSAVALVAAIAFWL